MAGRDNRFTIYDALEKAGYFESNPANTYARGANGENLFKGPVEFPKMLYHPKGEQREIVPGEVLNTPLGAKVVGQQLELIYQIVGSKEEEAQLVAEGWHNHPSKAIRARVEAYIEASPKISLAEKTALLRSIPVMSSDDRIKQLELELEKLTAQKASEAA